MALRTVTTTITEVANSEVTSEIYTALEGVPARIHNVWVEVAASKRLRLYLAQDKIVDIDLDCDALTQIPLEVDWPLSTGQVVKVAILDESGVAATRAIAVQIQESVS